MARADNNEGDRDVLSPIRAGDPEAFDALFRKEYSTLRDFAAAWSGRPDYADEIVSDVFLWLYEHRAELAPRTSIAAYLMGAVRHRALNIRRGIERSISRYNRLSDEAHESVVPQTAPVPDDALIEREQLDEQARRLAQALATVSQTARSIFLLRLQNGMSYAEISEALGVSTIAAKTQFSRTLATVRRQLAQDGDTGM